MLDRHIRWRNEHRLGMRQHLEAGLSVVVPHAGCTNAPKRHRLDEQVNVDLVDRTAAE